MRPAKYTRLLLFFSFKLVLLSCLSNCQTSLTKIINEGYGDYVLIPAGKFLMGDNFNDSYTDEKGFSQEKPVHNVNLNAFYIGKYEVTNEKFKNFIDDGGYSNPSYWSEEEKERATNNEGVRWPKMTSLNGYDSPSSIGVFLIWQQSHPIYFAEILYRNKKDKDILNKYKDIVFSTADFMASYAHWDNENNRYILGPPLITAQEIYKPTEIKNLAFELSYWRYGLKTAQQWRERLGLGRRRTSWST